MNIKPFKWTRGWILGVNWAKVAFSKEFYNSEQEALEDLPRVKKEIEDARERVYDDIIKELETNGKSSK